ncbi:MAG: flavodoxin [Desulfobulbus propionicus]|nr:MAG: flavodoxin [Desulfobulbus propionicus]
MPKALVVYGSTTGNTETVANTIGEVLQAQGVEATVKNVTDTTIEELGGEYDVTLLGSSTWGDDEIEFQEDFEPFYEQIGDAKQLSGKNVALFGCGDTSYEYFCGAVDKLEEAMGDLGAKIVNEPLRIDGDPGDAEGETKEWAEEVAKAVL